MVPEQIVLMTAPQWWEITAAVATALSAGVIAWQAFQTRKSVAASERAVAVAQAALVESQIARMESGVPQISIFPTGYIDAASAVVRIIGEGIGNTIRRPTTDDDVFKLPRDAGTFIETAYSFTARNDGPSSATLRFIGTRGVSMSPFREQLHPGESVDVDVTISRTVAEWVQLVDEVRPNGTRAAKRAAVLQVNYKGPRDADVDEVHRIVVHGSLLMPVEDAEGDWRPHHHPFEDQTFGVDMPTVERTYWRSRKANEKFDLE